MKKNIRKFSMFLASVMILSMLITNVFAAPIFPFTDVKTDAWYYKDVKNAYEKKLINGKTDTTYGPDENMTYAEAVKLAACMHQLKKEGSVKLKNATPWYQSYVDYAKKHKLITSDLPWNTKATRGGYMEVFANVLTDAESKKNNVPDGSIPDVGLTHQNATAIYKLYRAGIVTGVDAKHNCDPDASIKRSEVAAILTRMTDKAKRVAFSMSSSSTASSGGSGGGSPTPTPTPTPTPSTPSTPVNTLKIKTHPQSTETTNNDDVILTVEAEGGKKPYSYQWQILDVSKGEFVDLTGEDNQQGEEISGKRTDKLELYVSEQGDTDGDYTFRCVVKDADGNTVTSNAAFVKYTEIRIAIQPKHALNVKPLENVRFSVEAQGGKKPYTYLWQIKNERGYWDLVGDIPEYSKYFIGWKSADMNVKASKSEWVKDREFRCEVTDANGNWVYSDAAKLTVDMLRITEQPQNVTTTADENTFVGVSVKVAGGAKPYTFAWQVYRHGDFQWVNIGSSDPCYLIHEENESSCDIDQNPRNYLANKRLRCVITDASGDEVTTNEVKITITNP